jgi:hypothetical protein
LIFLPLQIRHQHLLDELPNILQTRFILFEKISRCAVSNQLLQTANEFLIFPILVLERLDPLQ